MPRPKGSCTINWGPLDLDRAAGMGYPAIARKHGLDYNSIQAHYRREDVLAAKVRPSDKRRKHTWTAEIDSDVMTMAPSKIEGKWGIPAGTCSYRKHVLLVWAGLRGPGRGEKEEGNEGAHRPRGYHAPRKSPEDAHRDTRGKLKEWLAANPYYWPGKTPEMAVEEVFG